MDSEERPAAERWSEEARIDAGIVRVRRGDVPRGDSAARWFIRGPEHSVEDLTGEAAAFPGSVPERIDGQAGLLVPRCEGGLLSAALRERGGMSATLALGVLEEVLELLIAAPPAPEGESRVALRGFAVDRHGGLVLLPARTRNAAVATDSAELGELLHLALTGLTWEETGVPLTVTAPEVPVAVAGLVTDLLAGTEEFADSHSGARSRAGAVGRVDLVGLRERIRALGPARERGFRPAEPGVDPDAAPTATLDADLVKALRAVTPAPTSAGAPKNSSAGEASVGNARGNSGGGTGASKAHARWQRRSTRRSNGSDRGITSESGTGAATRLHALGSESTRSQNGTQAGSPGIDSDPNAVGDCRVSRGPELRGIRARTPASATAAAPVRRRRWVAMSAALAAAVAGVSLLLTGSGDTPDDPQTPTAAAQQDEAHPGDTAAPDDTAPSHEPGPSHVPGRSHESAALTDPVSAVVELSRLRAEAIIAGDRAALAFVTVPGSPAARADSDLALEQESEPEASAGACTEACPPSAGPSLAVTDAELLEETSGRTEEARARVRATMRTDGQAPQTVQFVLARSDGIWRVHSVLPD